MANLSNINNILRTSSLGVGINCDAEFSLDIEKASANAILSLNSSGGSGAEYLLYSGTSGEFVLNKRYAGDRLTISSGGDATFSGSVGVGIAPAATFQVKVATDVNFTTSNNSGELRLNAVNDAVSATVPLEFNATNYEFLGTGSSTFGGSVTIETGINLESGVLVIKNATSDANGLRIFQDSSDASKIYNNYNGTLQLGVGNTTAITIDSSENTTFAGSVTTGTGLKLYTDGSGNGVIYNLGQDKDLYLVGDDGGAGVNALVFDMSAGGNATFIKEITSGDDINAGGKVVCANVGTDKKIAFRRTGANNWSIEHDASQIYFYNETSSKDILLMKNAGQIMLGEYGSGSFTGTTAYTLAVDSSGNIIETTDGGGDITGSGTANTVAKFTGAKAIGDGPITFATNDSTFAGNFHTLERAAVGTTPHSTIKLDVLSTATDWAARIKNYTNSGYGLAVDCSGAASSTTYALAAYSAAGGGLFVRNDDKVGINSTSPAALLEISGDGDAIRVESLNTGSGGAQVDLLHFTTSPADEDTFAVINAGGYYTGTTSVYGTQIKSIWTDVSERHSRLEFLTCDTSLSTALTLAHNLKATFTGDLQAPRIGIGAVNASFNLYNNGTSYFNGETTIDANLIMSQSNAEINFTSGNGVIQTTTGSTSLTFGVNGSEKMRIHSTGDVLIGATDPTSYNSNADDLIIYEANDFSGITLAADNDQGSNIYFADPDDDNVGGITYNHTSNYMMFRANGAERMRITSDGDVGIGSTSPSSYNSRGRNLVISDSWGCWNKY